MDLARIRAANLDGRTQNTRYRQSQFHRLQSALVERIADIQDAIRTDSGHTRLEVRAEVVLALQELRTHYTSMSLHKDLDAEYRIANGRDNSDNARGVGIVYIVPSTHTLFFSVISALAAALAAGNCIVLELPQTTMSLPALLRQILSDALDRDTFALTAQRPDSSFLNKTLQVVQAGSEESNGLISPATSRTVAVVDRTAKVTEAAQSLVAARFALGGRSTYSPDLVLVNEFVMKPFVEAAIKHASKYLAGENGETRQLPGVPRRSSILDSIQKDRSARILVSGSNWAVVEIQDRDETLAATYAFAAPASAKYLTQFIDADISWVNHVPSHMLIGPALPRNTSYNPHTRYATLQFQKPRPQLITPSASAFAADTILDGAHATRADSLWREALAPLPSTKQRPGFKIGFFEQGIITGGVLTLVSLIATASTLGYYTWVYVRTRG
ncbi:hypothetical protein N7462_006762 [Penicillium macrosclerotiorum]|uniref:uncharacterized protein n=1 Tax=Penicillium macrosclerotiorum TaxID=303699 RepID=UPI00254716DC|nr:uncharacterized protein N7462_006762 [Penicillium macrosclerotiorum]KAJ5683597.1 hypothetical protein N7462_006762 [Penicillium macrosclerotiorum]